MSTKGAISEDLLLDYLYDELDAEARARVEQALKASPELQTRLQALQQTRAFFSQAKAAEATLGAPALYTRALAVLAQEKEAKLPWWKALWSWGGAAWGGALAAAIALVVWQPWNRSQQQTLYPDEGLVQAQTTAMFEQAVAPQVVLEGSSNGIAMAQLEDVAADSIPSPELEAVANSKALVADELMELELAAVPKTFPEASRSPASSNKPSHTSRRERTTRGQGSSGYSAFDGGHVEAFGGSMRLLSEGATEPRATSSSSSFSPQVGRAVMPAAAEREDAVPSEVRRSEQAKMAKEAPNSELQDILALHERRIREALAAGRFEDAERLLEQAFKLGLSAQKHRELGALIDSKRDAHKPSSPLPASEP